MKAYLKNYRQASRKVRLVADSIRGENVADVLDTLSVMHQKSAPVLRKLVASALANAQQKEASLKAQDLKVETITVDKGTTFVRYKPRAFGRAAPIGRECAHIRVVLAPVSITSTVTTEEPTKNKQELVNKEK